MSVRGLLVDLDGTLADSVHQLKKVFFDFLLFYGVKSSSEEFTSYMGASLEEIIVSLKLKYSLDDSQANLFDRYLKEVLNVYSHKAKLMPGAKEALVLAREKGIKLGLVTAATEVMAKGFLASHDIEEYFDVQVAVRPGEPGKPHPALYERALSSLGLKSHQAKVIEDSLNGVKAGLAAGCEVFWLTDQESLAFSPKIRLIRDWNEIKLWLESL